MKKMKKFLRAPLASTLLLLAAIGLLGYSSISGAQAAISIFSQNYSAEVEMYDIGVSLLESQDNVLTLEDRISYRDYNKRNTQDRTGGWNEVTGALISNLQGKDIQLGQKYNEYIGAGNSGTINEYVRVTVYRYWLDENGKKMQRKAFSPDLIDLHFLPDDGGTAWVEDTSARTIADDPAGSERRVFYYQTMLAPGACTEPLTDTISIKDSAGGAVNYSQDGKIAYKYRGKTFVVEATVDAVQDHNVDLAKTSAWGQNR